MKFDRIVRLDEPGATTRWETDKGTVTIEDDSVKFDGKKHLILEHIISVERVRNWAWAHDLLQVDYSDGRNVETVYFAVGYRRGGAEAIDQLFQMLDKLSGSEQPESIAPEIIEKHCEEERTAREEKNRRAGMTMWVGAAIFMAGVVVTLVTYSRVASTGGSYIIAYGAIIGGLIILLKGFTMKEK